MLKQLKRTTKWNPYNVYEQIVWKRFSLYFIIIIIIIIIMLNIFWLRALLNMLRINKYIRQ